MDYTTFLLLGRVEEVHEEGWTQKRDGVREHRSLGPWTEIPTCLQRATKYMYKFSTMWCEMKNRVKIIRTG